MKTLTVGMTTHNDFDGVFFTLQSLRFNHPEALEELEFIVVDQNPDSPYGKLTKGFCEQIGARYIPQADGGGPTKGRDAYFSAANTQAVLSVDCHVLFAPGSIKKLVELFKQCPESKDLYHGPLVYNDLKNISTHWTPEWKRGAQNFGSWAYDPKGQDPNGPLFEIPFQGVGVMACNKHAWPGYNKDFIGFGAEEWYIHRKFRCRGGHIWCAPWLRWLHRFGRMPHATYTLCLWHKMYNHLLGSIELNDTADVLVQLQHWHDINPNELHLAMTELTRRGYITLKESDGSKVEPLTQNKQEILSGTH